MERDENEEAVLEILRKSRKAFLVEYACGFLLLAFLAYLYLKGVRFSPRLSSIGFSYIVFGIAIIFLAYGEIARQFTRYMITNTKVIIIKGILRQNKKNVHFLPLGFIPEINMKQTALQRLLDYGTVFVHSSGENSFEIKDVNQPQEVMETIEKLIDQNRRGQAAKRSGKPKSLLNRMGY